MPPESFYRSPSNLLKDLGIMEPEDIDIEAIAQYCGATIIYEVLEGCEARIIGNGDRAIITVNSRSIRERQRFSAAHDLGHWLCDRGKVAISCTEKTITSDWSQSDREGQANRFAADLLLPEIMFGSRSKNREIIFSTATELANLFQTSLTATAIRLVELGSFPAMIICNERGRRKWFFRGPVVPESLWPNEILGKDTLAYELLCGASKSKCPMDVSSAGWFDHPQAYRYVVREDSIKLTSDMALTLLWWKDERQILAIQEDEEEETE